MKNIKRSIITGLLMLCSSLLSADPEAKAIVVRSEELVRGNNCYAVVLMSVEKPRFQRSMEVEYFDNRLENKMFLRMILPRKDEGITFLKLQNNLWQYIPSIGKEIKIEASLMQDAWMGSDFSNDDLVKESSLENDFDHSFISRNVEQDIIQLIPKPEAAVVWSKIIITYDKATGLALKEEFFDHKNRLKKILLLSEIKEMSGRKIPTKMIMATISDGKAVSKTTLQYKTVKFNTVMQLAVFTKANLRVAR